MNLFKHFWKAAICLSIIISISSCVRQKAYQANDNITIDNDANEFVNLNINMSQEFFDSIKNQLPVKDIIVLKESDDIMFADLDKIIENQGVYYVLDSFGAKTLVAFDVKGNAYAKYGKIGQGPGEYVRPWDFDVYNSQIYILDSNSKKIIRFSTNGVFIDEKHIPFPAKGFKILKDGKMMFSLLPSGDGGPRLCLADSTLSQYKYLLNSEKGFVGGFHTNNIFRHHNSDIIYYESPLDTLFCFNGGGDLTGGIVFDFGDKHVPHEAKLDYLMARESGLLENTLRFNDSPIYLDNGIIVGTIYDDRSQYIILANTEKKISGLKRCDPKGSIYDIIEPVTVDSQGNLVCYTCKEFMEQAEDYDALDDSIKSYLEDNEYVLISYSQKQSEIND